MTTVHVDFTAEAQARVERLWDVLRGVPISPERKERMAMAALETGLLVDGVPSPCFTMLTKPDDEASA